MILGHPLRLQGTMDHPEIPPRIPEHRLIRRIGRGASGEVWLAHDALGNWRAVKLVFSHGEGGEATVRRELAGLRRYEPVCRSHPALLDILFAGTDPEKGTLYYVMELADDASATAVFPSPGGPTIPQAPPQPAVGRALSPDRYVPDTLSRRIRHAVEAAEPIHRRLPSGQVLDLALDLAAALVHLHAAGLVHRDLKPGNVVFVGGRACLADCGLVSTSTLARSFVGTEGFIPPEGPGSRSADLYALGKVLYEAAFGLDRNDWPELPAWLGTAPDTVRLRGLLEVVRRACERDPARRYSSAAALLADLQRLAAGTPLTIDWAQRRRLLARGAVAAGLCVLLGLAFRGVWRDHAAAVPGRSSDFSVEMLPLRPDDYAGLLPFRAGTNGSSLRFFAARQQDALLLSRGGERLGVWSFDEPGSTGLRLCQVTDVNGDGSEDALYAWRDGTNLHLSAVSQYPREFLRLSIPGRWDQTVQPPVLLTHFGPLAVTAGRADRPGEVLALTVDEPGKDPAVTPQRALLSFSLPDGRLRWQTPIAGGHVTDLAVVAGEPQGVAYLFGGYGSSNGVQVTQQVHRASQRPAQVVLDDQHAYLHAFDRAGRLLWAHELADFWVNCRPLVLSRPGSADFYAWVWANDDARRQHGLGEVGRLHRFDPAGTPLGVFDRGCAVFDPLITDLEGDGRPEFLLTDSQGRITVLDPELRTLREVPLIARRFKRVELRWLGEADLDGDGVKELVLASVQVQPEQLGNFSEPDGSGKFWSFYDAELLVLDRSLRIRARHRVAPTAERNPCETLQLSNLNPERRWEILRQGQQVEVIRWRAKGMP